MAGKVVRHRHQSRKLSDRLSRNGFHCRQWRGQTLFPEPVAEGLVLPAGLSSELLRGKACATLLGMLSSFNITGFEIRIFSQCEDLTSERI